MTGYALAFGSLLLLGGRLSDSFGRKRWCLYVNLIIAAVAFAGAPAFLHDGDRPERVRLDIAGTVTAVLGFPSAGVGRARAAPRLPPFGVVAQQPGNAVERE